MGANMAYCLGGGYSWINDFNRYWKPNIMNNNLDDLAKFLQEQIERMEALRTNMVECNAVWLPYKVGGTMRVEVGSMVAIKDNKLTDADHATHKLIGIYSTIGSEKVELILTDVITQEPMTLIL
jgi:hypothetical protein